MPRKPTFHHPLRDLREAIGCTQDAFARLVGVGRDTIQSIENGRLPLSSHLAFKVRRQTGCVLRRVVRDGLEHFEVRSLSTDTLRAYTRADFDDHRQSMADAAKEDLDHTCAAAARCLDLLIRSAARRGGGTMLALRDDLEQFITDTFEGYKLAPELAALLRDEWKEFNPEALDVERTVKSFPMSPLSTAYPFPTLHETKPAGVPAQKPARAAAPGRSARGR